MSAGPAGTALPPIFLPRALRLCTAWGLAWRGLEHALHQNIHDWSDQ